MIDTQMPLRPPSSTVHNAAIESKKILKSARVKKKKNTDLKDLLKVKEKIKLISKILFLICMLLDFGFHILCLLQTFWTCGFF